jgi:TolB protein
MRMAKRLVGRVMWAERTRRIFTLGLVAALAAFGCALLTVEPTQAAFPGQNGKIAFHHDGDIWTMNGSGAGKTQLTTNYNFEGNPAVSPDGEHIAYEFYSGIWVMNADGSGKRALTDGTGRDEEPAWSADGTKIVFSRGGDLWTMNANGSGQRNLTRTAVGDEHDAAWSPAGDKIVYTLIGGACEGGACVFTINPDGSGQTNLTPEDTIPGCQQSPGYRHEGTSREPAWSPDGLKIVYSGALICSHVLGKDIWVMNANGGEKTNLINDDATMDLRPTFSPDGQKILFESDRDSDGAPELYTMSATDGSGMTRLTTNTVWDSEADWGPFDITGPRVVRVTPPNSATGVSPGANVSATFSEAMRAATLNKTTFKLVRRGTTTPVPATVNYAPDATKATLNPAGELDSGVTYTATITTGAKDTAGNALPTNETWNFKVR